VVIYACSCFLPHICRQQQQQQRQRKGTRAKLLRRVLVLKSERASVPSSVFEGIEWVKAHILLLCFIHQRKEVTKGHHGTFEASHFNTKRCVYPDITVHSRVIGSKQHRKFVYLSALAHSLSYYRLHEWRYIFCR
jgi:hypothetical protein